MRSQQGQPQAAILRRLNILVLAVLIAICALALLLQAGLAVPPRPPNILLTAAAPADLRGTPIYHERDETFTDAAANAFTLSRIYVLNRHDWMLEVAAAFGSPPRPWGIWLEPGGASPPTLFMIHPDGYMSITQSPQLDWQGFIHIRPDHNRLTLSSESNSGTAAFSINHERAWSGTLPQLLISPIGIVFDSSSPPNWQSIQLNGG